MCLGLPGSFTRLACEPEMADSRNMLKEDALSRCSSPDGLCFRGA